MSKMSKSKKILIGVISLILAVALIWIIYYLVHYLFYGEYKKYLSSYEYETGAEFSPITESVSDVEGMVLAAENESLKLYVNTETAEVAVYDKRNGQITYSNPQNADEDTIANETNKNYMKSQLILTFFNAVRLEQTFDSYSYSTSRGQLEVEAIEGGVRFVYTLGDLTSATGIVPQYISKEALDRVAAALSEEDAKQVTKKYKESNVAEGYYELLEATMKGPSQLRKLNTYFEAAGFTQEEYNIEMENSGVEGAVPISFVIPLEYRLNEDAVDVSIPMNGVEEYGGGSVYRIQLLNYFGAAGPEEEGYMLVPNGSGSLINFNSGKGAAIAGTDYSEYVYGIDPLAAEYTVRENTEDMKMALFGLFRDNSSIFATIEDGASLATISANSAGEYTTYNNVYTTFIVRGNDKLSMFGTTGSEGDLPIVEKTFYDANLAVKYTMLTDENPGYEGAANYYRDRLIAEGVLTPQETTGDIKFYYDVLSGVETTKFFLGTQYRGLNSMTTFNQAEAMSNELAENGITNQVMNLQGWCNGGYYHDVLNKIKVPWKLGGKSGLEDLSATVEENGGILYVDTAFQKVTEVSSRYSETNETSRYYGGGYIAQFGLVNPATLRQTSGLNYAENRFYLISPKFLVRYIARFADRIEGYDVGGISLRDLGNELHSDKKRTEVIMREDALDVVLGQFQVLADTGKSLMVNDGNDYTFAYASDIINAPLTGNDYYIVDETVPFYQMLIHGCIDYSGTVINLEDTTSADAIVLELIQAGASPHFLFSWDSPNEIKYTGLKFFYATTYENWKDDAIDIYTRVNEALSQVSGAYMTGFETLEENVTAVTYSNGITFYINKGTTNKTINGVSVPAGSYGIGGAK